MNTTLLYLFGFIVVMTLILWMMPSKKIRAAADFFAKVLPKIPLVGMIKAYNESKAPKNTGKA